MPKENMLLHACKMAHRKHCLNDDSIGWEELTDILNNAICNELGDDEYCKWIDSLNKGGKIE